MYIQLMGVLNRKSSDAYFITRPVTFVFTTPSLTCQRQRVYLVTRAIHETCGILGHPPVSCEKVAYTENKLLALIHMAQREGKNTRFSWGTVTGGFLAFHEFARTKVENKKKPGRATPAKHLRGGRKQ